jgi:hypothetical protein
MRSVGSDTSVCLLFCIYPQWNSDLTLSPFLQTVYIVFIAFTVAGATAAYIFFPEVSLQKYQPGPSSGYAEELGLFNSVDQEQAPGGSSGCVWRRGRGRHLRQKHPYQ